VETGGAQAAADPAFQKSTTCLPSKKSRVFPELQHWLDAFPAAARAALHATVHIPGVRAGAPGCPGVRGGRGGERHGGNAVVGVLSIAARRSRRRSTRVFTGRPRSWIRSTDGWLTTSGRSQSIWYGAQRPLAADYDDLMRMLAAEIDSEPDRRAFISSCRQFRSQGT